MDNVIPGWMISRPALRIALVLAALSTLFTACVEKESGLRLSIVTGGHDFEREAFFAMFDSFIGIDYEESIQPEANQMFATAKIDSFDVVVFYDMFQEIDESGKQAFMDLFETGKGVVFLHHSLASYQSWDQYLEIVGGKYYEEPAVRNGQTIAASTFKHDVEIPVKIVDPEHPVTSGLFDFVIFDEVYGGFEVLPSVHPLLATSHPESGPIIAWTFKCKNSRVVYIQPGHDHHGYENENYRRLVYQAIRWVAGK